MNYKHSTIWIEEVTEIPAELVADWTNRNTITGEVIFDMLRMPKGTHSEPIIFDRAISSPMEF